MTGSEELLIRGIGLVELIDEIKKIPLGRSSNVPIYIEDIAEVDYGEEIRRGVVTLNGEREVVSGIVMKLYGENTSKVIERLHVTLTHIKSTLPEGVELVSYYDQADLVENAASTLTNALAIGALLVLLVLFVFLGSMKVSVIVVVSLPLCAMVAVLILDWLEISANVMSLGGIAVALGMLCDGSIVMVESIIEKLRSKDDNSEEQSVVAVAHAVSRPIVFSGVIVILVFLPLLTLEGVEGKMFSPLAFSATAAMAGSVIVALFVLPSIGLVLLPKESLTETRIVKSLKKYYERILKNILIHKRFVPIVAVVLFLFSLFLLFQLGTEFIPVFEEGSIFIGMAMAPSISLHKATEKVFQAEQLLSEFPEVVRTVTRIGRPEAGSHPHPINYAEIYVKLSPEPWDSGRDKQKLIEDIEEKLEVITGKQLLFTQPIQNAFDELISGIKTQFAVKVFGDDLHVLQRKVDEIYALIKNVDGLVDLSVEQNYGQPQLQIIPDRELCSRYGVSVDEIMNLVELAIGGAVVDYIYPGMRRFGIHLRYDESYRDDPQTIGELLVRSDYFGFIPLSHIADVKVTDGPIQINRENNQRRWYVQGNIRGRDIGSVVADVQRLIRDDIELEAGYYIDYGGQFENQQRAMRRLAVLVPVVIFCVFILLWINFATFWEAAVIFVMVPMSVVGGVLGLYIMGEYLSVPALVGFIALFGMAMLDGLVIISRFSQLKEQGKNAFQAVIEGSVSRLAPVLMTTLTTFFGLLPLLLATGIGSEIQRPLASVVVFALITSTLITLVLIPSIYLLIDDNT